MSLVEGSFERTHCLEGRFIYSTPYTVSGKRDAGPEQQCLRKTILTVETSFPNVRKRLRVIQKEEVPLTPSKIVIFICGCR